MIRMGRGLAVSRRAGRDAMPPPPPPLTAATCRATAALCASTAEKGWERAPPPVFKVSAARSEAARGEYAALCRRLRGWGRGGEESGRGRESGTGLSGTHLMTDGQTEARPAYAVCRQLCPVWVGPGQCAPVATEFSRHFHSP